MTAQFAKDQVSYLAPVNLSEAAPSAFAPANENGLAVRVRAATAWVSALLKRRAVMNELSMLSDHELADIGLTRSDIPRVFDRSFVACRGTPRAA